MSGMPLASTGTPTVTFANGLGAAGCVVGGAGGGGATWAPRPVSTTSRPPETRTAWMRCWLIWMKRSSPLALRS